MPNMEDYASLLLALTTLAKAPVAAFPDSGAMKLAEQGQDVARAKLAEEATKKAQKKAKKKQRKGALARTVGTTVGSVVGGPIGAAVGGTAADVFTKSEVDPSQIATAFAESREANEGASQYGLIGDRLSKRRRRRTRRNESRMEAGGLESIYG